MPNSEKGLNEFRKKYYGKLDTIDGVQYLMSGSTGPAGIFFKNPTDAARFTNKYKNHNDELMKKLGM